MRRVPGKTLIIWAFSAVVCAVTILHAFDDIANGSTALDPGALLFALTPIIFVIPAALIIAHQPRNTVGWLLMALPVSAIPVGLSQSYLQRLTAAPPATLPIIIVLDITGISWLAMIMPLLLVPLFFPTGRLLSPSWRWVVYLAVGMSVFLFFWGLFPKKLQPDFAPWSVNNPFGFITAEIDQAIMGPWAVLLAVVAVTSLVSFVIRYRRAGLVEREQIKWLLFAVVVFGAVFVPSLFLHTEYLLPPYLVAFNFVFFAAILGIPVAITIAILRYHLFDIDVIIRQTLVYATVTALLGLVYAGGVVLLQQAFRAVTGQTSDLAVVVTTLIIAVLFNPLRGRVQAIINRRFYREKYSADQALAEFAIAARSGADLDALTGMLGELVAKTLQPTEVRMFIKRTKK